MSDIKLKLLRPSMEVETQFGSLDELIGWLGSQKASLTKLFGDNVEAVIEDLGDSTALSTGTVTTSEADTTKPARKKRNQPDPSTATAPDPIAPPAAPVEVPADGSIPAFLDRTNPAAAVNQAPAAPTPPPPPLMPSAPPIAPAAPTPPTGVLAGKLIEWLDGKQKEAADGGKALIAWLQNGLVKNDPSVTWDEAIAVVRLASDAQVGPFAKAVGIPA